MVPQCTFSPRACICLRRNLLGHYEVPIHLAKNSRPISGLFLFVMPPLFWRGRRFDRSRLSGEHSPGLPPEPDEHQRLLAKLRPTAATLRVYVETSEPHSCTADVGAKPANSVTSGWVWAHPRSSLWCTGLGDHHPGTVPFGKVRKVASWTSKTAPRVLAHL